LESGSHCRWGIGVFDFSIQFLLFLRLKAMTEEEKKKTMLLNLTATMFEKQVIGTSCQIYIFLLFTSFLLCRNEASDSRAAGAVLCVGPEKHWKLS
jgi:hypothetical protein